MYCNYLLAKKSVKQLMRTMNTYVRCISDDLVLCGNKERRCSLINLIRDCAPRYGPSVQET